MLAPENVARFRNPFYAAGTDATTRVLLPQRSVLLRSVTFWSAYFLRWGSLTDTARAYLHLPIGRLYQSEDYRAVRIPSRVAETMCAEVRRLHAKVAQLEKDQK